MGSPEDLVARGQPWEADALARHAPWSRGGIGDHHAVVDDHDARAN
jgi:hypothetical protein